MSCKVLTVCKQELCLLIYFNIPMPNPLGSQQKRREKKRTMETKRRGRRRRERKRRKETKGS